MKSVQQRARISRVLTTLLCAAFLLADLASSLHDSTVRHILCPEHGEWEHVAAVSGDADTCAHDEASPTAPRYHKAPRQEGIEHEHCPLVMLGRTPYGLPSADLPALDRPDESAKLAPAAEQPLRARVAFGARLARGPPARA